jgi:hypothetical protein
MSGLAPREVLAVGDRVRFGDRVHTVVGLSGTTVRLVDEYGSASLVLFSHLVGPEGFALLDCQPGAPALPPFGLLDTVPDPALRKAKFFEQHLIEVETGVRPDAEPGTAPRPEFDPLGRRQGPPRLEPDTEGRRWPQPASHGCRSLTAFLNALPEPAWIIRRLWRSLRRASPC